MELKKRLLINEDTISFLKSENHRLETEATKQQRRIEQLLNLSEGVKTSSMAQSVRREIEKSILVRQLKQQLAHLRNLVADKDIEIENMKRDIRFTRVKEVEFERDEYYAEIQRLLRTVEEVKEDLLRERQRREWNSKLAGETGDDLRRELAKLASGYQSILANISTTGKPAPQRPSTAGAVRSSDANSHPRKSDGDHSQHYGRDQPQTHLRPRSAGANPSRPAQTALKATKGASAPTHNDEDNSVNVAEQELHINMVGDDDVNGNMESWEALNTTELDRPSLEAGFNTEDYEMGDGDGDVGARGISVEPKTTFQPLGSFLPQQQAVYIQHPQIIMALPTIPQHPVKPPKFSAGDRVKAKFRGGDSYYSGRISVVQADGLYRVIYDDNDEEGNVPESRILLFDEVEGTNSSAASVASSQVGKNLYKVNDKVEALYYNGTTWYKGEVKGFTFLEAKKSFVYDVVYEDGDREKQVLEANVRSLNPPTAVVEDKSSKNANSAVATPQMQHQASAETILTIDETTILSVPPAATVTPVAAPATTKSNGNEAPKSSPRTMQSTEPPKEQSSPKIAATKAEFQKDDVIEALYDKGTMWFPGKISAVHISGTNVLYDVLYDDGDHETNVADAFIRKRNVAASSSSEGVKPASTSGTANAYKVGEKIEGYFEEYKAWFGGTIKSINEDGTYYVTYDDGDEEKRVLSIRLRKKAVSIRKDKYQVGDKVEARYQGDAAWFPGEVSKVNFVDGKYTYNILYEDGDTEEGLLSELIRVVDMTLSKAPSSADLAAASAQASSSVVVANSVPVVEAPDTAATPVPVPVTVTPVKTSPRQVKQEGSNNSKQAQRHGSQHTITSTNLDNFLNELSDDDDGPLPPIGVVESSGENEYRDEFEA